MKHFGISLGITIAALTGLAGAQTITPTLGGSNQVVGTGTTTASAQQTVNLKLPEATAIHLATTNLEFDISKIGSQDGTWYCAYGLPGSDGVARDVSSDLGADFWNQKQVLPLGTSYSPDLSEFGKISINAGDKVTAYPPVDNSTGTVNNKSKAYFVCYRTFIIQKFSNLGNFKLSVSRDNPAVGERGNQLLYIQDNPCHTWGKATGLYALPVGGIRELIPKYLTEGTTGMAANGKIGMDGRRVSAPTRPKYCREYTSWLDDLVVMAVVVDGDSSGDNVATLTYTLESKAAPFVLSDSDAN